MIVVMDNYDDLENYIVNYGAYHFFWTTMMTWCCRSPFFLGGSTSFGFRRRCQAREPDRWARNLRAMWAPTSRRDGKKGGNEDGNYMGIIMELWYI